MLNFIEYIEDNNINLKKDTSNIKEIQATIERTRHDLMEIYNGQIIGVADTMDYKMRLLTIILFGTIGAIGFLVIIVVISVLLIYVVKRKE